MDIPRVPWFQRRRGSPFLAGEATCQSGPIARLQREGAIIDFSPQDGRGGAASSLGPQLCAPLAGDAAPACAWRRLDQLPPMDRAARTPSLQALLTTASCTRLAWPTTQPTGSGFTHPAPPAGDAIRDWQRIGPVRQVYDPATLSPVPPPAHPAAGGHPNALADKVNRHALRDDASRSGRALTGEIRARRVLSIATGGDRHRYGTGRGLAPMTRHQDYHAAVRGRWASYYMRGHEQHLYAPRRAPAARPRGVMKDAYGWLTQPDGPPARTPWHY